MSFLEFLNTELAPREDKATGEDFILAVRKLQDVTADAIPNCIYDYEDNTDAREIIASATAALEDNDPDAALTELRKYERPRVKVNIERLFILIWVMALREQPDIILEDIAKIVDMTKQDSVTRLLRRIWSFWTATSEENLDEEAENVELIAVDDSPEEREVNPPAGSP